MANPKRANSATRAATGSGPSRGKGKRKRNPWLRALMWTMISLLGLGLIGVGGIAYAYVTIQVPDENAEFLTNTTSVYYADGKQKIGSFQVQNRQSIAYDQMPQYVKDAIVAGENKDFWTDPGISPTGLLRASLGLIGIAPPDATATGGGSTITQQYIKVMYLTQEKTFTRKAKEILLAAKIGNELSKEDILGRYLNTVYFGRGAYGIQAAAQAYFKKNASKLDLGESVALAAIVNLPGRLDPATGDNAAADLLERYQYILNNMLTMGKISQSQHDAIYYTLPKFPEIQAGSQFGGTKGYLLKMVEKEMLAKGFTDDQITGGGLKIVTTFDAKAQDAMTASVEKGIKWVAAGTGVKASSLHPGMASIDNATGGVLAIYGGADYVKNNRNWATTTTRTGSTFKPYTLVAALRDGWTLSDTVSGNTLRLPGSTKPITNAGGANYGRVNLLTATTKSINTAFVDLATKLTSGYESILQAANDAGVPTAEGWDAVPTATLGVPEVSPLYQAAGYSTFANEGVRRAPHVVAKVIDLQGRTLFEADTSGTQAIEADIARDVTYALEHVAQDGTGSRAAALGYPVGGKTGTVYYTVNGKPITPAIWFVGFTKQITTAINFVRGDSGTESLGAKIYGSKWPAMTWLDYMQKAMDGKPKVDFADPSGRVSTQKPTPANTSTSANTPTAPPTTPTPTVPTPPTTPTAPTTPPPTTPTPPKPPTTPTPTAGGAGGKTDPGASGG
ncbi:membrane peptidoglycan carboxypeptidase [Propionicimonas paludicola]|uniref:Membrane peptidoglycan carboxypeptidase n=1 Tax=Propionicimonas paludicola TaxID=185243 RepID=A0A2A9CVF0_9ACTN|nr:transglycosylase domain-containing protein [Propionicimonas paludicola]PFG18126.1 membrane peptidoglycan carboxypeptidase [Propionicimonas paludicola]